MKKAIAFALLAATSIVTLLPTAATAATTGCEYASVRVYDHLDQRGRARTICPTVSVVDDSGQAEGFLYRDWSGFSIASFRSKVAPGCTMRLDFNTGYRGTGVGKTYLSIRNKAANLPVKVGWDVQRTKYVWKRGWRFVLGGWVYGVWRVKVTYMVYVSRPVRDAVKNLRIEVFCEGTPA